jgi:formate dehydrogenase maturation protein FdhE
VSEPWTFDRVAEAKPELAGLARLHAVLDEVARRFDEQHHVALHPNFTAAPATHWLAGRSLFDSSNRAALSPAVAALFDALARAAADAFPETRGAVEEMRAAAVAWPQRLVSFRDVPDDDSVPHAALFRFLLLRAVSVPAAHLARSFSPPHQDRWKRGACPYCGVPAAAAVAGQGAGRTLLCVLCGGRWPREGHDCVACGEERPETRMVLADRGLGPASLEACATCRSGIKVFAPADVPHGPPVALEVLTVHLDVLAKAQGYAREEAALAAVFPPP